MTDQEKSTDDSARPTRLAYYASLDGLRGIVIIALLFYHSGVDWIPGGFLSVSTFFTLSGFLITSLLLYERDAEGHIDLARFWARRFRRLMPAALAALAGIALLGVAIGDGSQLLRLRWDGIAALFYASNWRFIYVGNDYADLFASPSLVQHFWSLSIEEQFYVTFPPLAIVTLRRFDRRGFAIVLFGLTLLSTLWMAALFEPDQPTSRLYFGTDTRAAEILLGALFAIWHAGRPPLHGTGRRTAIALGCIGVFGTFAFWFGVSDQTPWLWQGGFSLYALLSVATIAGAVQPSGPAHTLLGWGPLPWLGKVSYGAYLYHFPVYVTLTNELTGLTLWPLLGLRIAVTFALTIASYYVLEQPVRKGMLITGRQPALAVPASVVSIVLAFIVATIDPPAPAVDLRELSDDLRRVESNGPRIMIAGDSVAFGIGKAMQRWAERTQRASVYNVARRGCGIARGGRLMDRFKKGGDLCDNWPAYWSTRLDQFSPDIIVMLTGGWDLKPRQLPGWNEERLIGDAVYDAWLLSEFGAAVDLLTSRGARIVWLRTPCVAPRPEGGVWDPARTADLNRILDELAAQRGTEFELLDLHARVCPDGEFTNTLAGMTGFRPDGAHFSDAGADWLAQWLAVQLIPAAHARSSS